MAGFFLVWWSYGYGLPELQVVIPALLSHQADPLIVVIYFQAITLTLTAIVACQVSHGFACQSEQTSMFQMGFFTDHLIWWEIGMAWALAMAMLVLAMVYLSPLRQIFGTTPLIEEIRKAIVCHLYPHRRHPLLQQPL